MSSKTIYDKVQEIKTEKDTKIVPGNIKKGVTIFDVQGNCGNVTANIYTQTTEPTSKEGIWLDTDNTFDKIEFTDNVSSDPYYNSVKTANISSIPYDFNDGAITTVGTNIYLFGGSTNKNTAYKYNTITNTYTKLTDIPVQIYRSGIESFGTDIYLFGSYNSDSWTNPYKYVYKYDTLTDTYTKMNDMPYGFYSGNVHRVGNYIYILLSAGSSWSTKGYKYDPQTDTYTQLTSFSNGNFNVGPSGVYGTDIYLFILYYIPGDYALGFFKYDTLTDTYTELTTYNRSVFNVSGYWSYSIKDKYLYMFSGNKRINYNCIDLEYTEVSDIAYSVSVDTSRAVLMGTDIYIIGGYNNPTKVQVLTVPYINFEDNSLIIQNGTNYKTQLYTNEDIEGRVLNYFSNVYTYTDADGLEQEYDTYYGDGTQWIQINNS